MVSIVGIRRHSSRSYHVLVFVRIDHLEVPSRTSLWNPSLHQVEQVRFSGDFESIIGNNAEQFLEECSTKLRPVRCRDVQPGSVVVTLEGSSWAELEEAHAQFSKGLNLPSFGTLEKEKDEKDEKDEKEKEDTTRDTTRDTRQHDQGHLGGSWCNG